MASGFFSAMKSQPLALALSVVVLALLYYVHDIREHELRLAAEHQKQTAELFTRFCAPPP